MKRYIVPKLQFVDLRLEERIATICTGCCNEADAQTYGLIALSSGS